MLLNGDCPESLKKEEGAPEPPRENGLDEAEPGEETTGQEVIVIQDTGFSVKILAPGIEPFSLQVGWGPRPTPLWEDQGEASPCLYSSWSHVIGRKPRVLCLAQGHSAGMVDVGFQVQVIVPLLGDSSQLGLPVLFGEMCGGWVVVASRAPQPSALCSQGSHLSLAMALPFA